jgi:hypothetical protein
VRHRHPWHIGELACWRWKAGDLDPAPTAAERLGIALSADPDEPADPKPSHQTVMPAERRG